jgi:hypothetical protein
MTEHGFLQLEVGTRNVSMVAITRDKTELTGAGLNHSMAIGAKKTA